MREIKFRAWHKSTKTMFFVKVITMTSKGVFACFLTDEISSRDVNPDEIELLQFTGLCDKKGKEIYDKDKLMYPGKPCMLSGEWLVRWYKAGWVIQAEEGTIIPLYKNNEDLELLKEKP